MCVPEHGEQSSESERTSKASQEQYAERMMRGDFPSEKKLE